MCRKSDTAPLICYCSAYLVILLYHTRRQVRMYSAKFSKNKVCLFIHIGTGVMELSRYHISKAQFGNDNTLPEVIDVLSCFVWSWTSLVLVKTLRRGDPRTTRPPYQTGALLRPVISTISYLLQLPSLHRVSISALDSFLYARLGMFFLLTRRICVDTRPAHFTRSLFPCLLLSVFMKAAFAARPWCFSLRWPASQN